MLEDSLVWSEPDSATLQKSLYPNTHLFPVPHNTPSDSMEEKQQGPVFRGK